MSSDDASMTVLKFMLFSAFFALQDAFPAVAASDFSTGLNSIPIFGDVGD